MQLCMYLCRNYCLYAILLNLYIVFVSEYIAGNNYMISIITVYTCIFNPIETSDDQYKSTTAG